MTGPPGVEFLMVLVYVFYAFGTIFTGMSTSGAIAVGDRGVDIGRTLGVIGGRAKVGVVCRSTALGGMPLGLALGGRPLRRTLSIVYDRTNVHCRLIRGGCILVLPVSEGTGHEAVAKIVGSSANRPIVKTSVIVRNAAFNAMTGVSKRFVLSCPRGAGGSRLVVDFVNVRAIGRGVNGERIFGMGVRDRMAGLSRIIMMNCNASSVGSLANSITSMNLGRLDRLGAPGMASVLRGLTTNMRMSRGANIPNRAIHMHIQNTASLANSGRPLCIVSKIPMRSPDVLSTVSPGSVRSVSMLGSTSTTTVCNSHTTGNMIVIAAGGKIRNSGPAIDFGCGIAASIRVGGFHVLCNSR